MESITTISNYFGISVNVIIAIFYAIVIWQIPWKGVAMWKAAKKGHLIWFIVFLIVNLLAIPEILYIFIFSKKGKQEKVKKKRKS